MVWTEWKRLTRFFESARLALSREHQLWGTLELADADQARVRVDSGTTTYEVSLTHHREAVTDGWLLNASVLTYSYALAEAAAADRLGIDDASDIGGIEAWGQGVLDLAGTNWTQVMDGRAGAVEVAVVRNLIAHGERSFSQRSINRLAAAGVAPLPSAGDALVLDYDKLRQCRGRLKSLLRVAQIRA